MRITLHVEAPFVTEFEFLIFGFFLDPKIIQGDAKNAIPVVGKSRSPKAARVTNLFVELGTFFQTPHHIRRI